MRSSSRVCGVCQMTFTKRTHSQTMSGRSAATINTNRNSLRWIATSFAFVVTALALLPQTTLGQQYDTKLYEGMRWRQIGPFRAGRVSAVAGVPGDPSVFYMATPGGGVWKTVDGGTVWRPISDQVPVASIGAMAVAQSDTKVI